MKQRIISGILIMPLLALCYFRGIPLAVAVFIVAAIGVKELYDGFSAMDIKPNLWIAWGCLASLVVMHFCFEDAGTYLVFWIVLSLMLSCISIFKIEEHKAEDGLATIFGIVYVELLAYHLLLIDKAGYGKMIWMVIIVAFATDTFAYFTGYFLGKHKLCPNLSPKKTVEGAVGGVVGALLCSIIFGIATGVEIVPHLLIMAVIGSVLAQLGDLTASAYKRKMGIKDYGKLIPGHGGILDRFDSILFAAPAVYYYIRIVALFAPEFQWFN